MTACRHGFDPDTTMPEHLREAMPVCPSCEWEARLPWPARFVATHPRWGPWISVFGLGLSIVALIMAVGCVNGWW
jgi:hypothetical protein